MVNTKDIKISRLKFKEEHERLLKVLEKPTKVAIKKEYNLQRKEMVRELHPKLTIEEIKEETKKKQGKHKVQVFDKSKSKNKKK